MAITIANKTVSYLSDPVKQHYSKIEILSYDQFLEGVRLPVSQGDMQKAMDFIKIPKDPNDLYILDKNGDYTYNHRGVVMNVDFLETDSPYFNLKQNFSSFVPSAELRSGVSLKNVISPTGLFAIDIDMPGLYFDPTYSPEENTLQWRMSKTIDFLKSRPEISSAFQSLSTTGVHAIGFLDYPEDCMLNAKLWDIEACRTYYEELNKYYSEILLKNKIKADAKTFHFVHPITVLPPRRLFLKDKVTPLTPKMIQGDSE